MLTYEINSVVAPYFRGAVHHQKNNGSIQEIAAGEDCTSSWYCVSGGCDGVSSIFTGVSYVICGAAIFRRKKGETWKIKIDGGIFSLLIGNYVLELPACPDFFLIPHIWNWQGQRYIFFTELVKQRQRRL